MSSFIFIDKGTTVRLALPAPSGAMDHLPAKVYTIEHDDDGLFLKVKTERFTVPEKIYGKTHAHHVKLVCGDWNPNGSVGAMFVGAKGNGKSLTAESIANKMIDKGVPTIYIDTQIPAGAVKHVIRNIGPCTVIFEEFGKMYPIPEGNPNAPVSPVAAEQDQMLSLFSDTSLKGVIFLITENAINTINQHLYARPDRVKYFFRYSSPGMDVFKDIAEGYPIHEEIMSYMEFLFSDTCGTFSSSDYGIDVLRVYRDNAVNVTTVEDFVEKLSYMNVPAACRINYRIETVFNSTTGAVYSNFSVSDCPNGKSKVVVFDEHFAVCGEFLASIDEFVFVMGNEGLGKYSTGPFKGTFGEWSAIGDASPWTGDRDKDTPLRFIMPRSDMTVHFGKKAAARAVAEKEVLGEKAYAELVEKREAASQRYPQMQQMQQFQQPTLVPLPNNSKKKLGGNSAAMKAGMAKARGSAKGTKVIES